MALSKTTQDHDEIQQWAEARGAKPAAVAATEKQNSTGIIRLMFPDAPNANDRALEEISWDEFFEKFDGSGLEFTYQEKTAGGEESNFNKLTYPEVGAKRAKKNAGTSNKKSVGTKASAKRSSAKKTAAKRTVAKKSSKTASKSTKAASTSARKATGSSTPKKAASKKTTSKKVVKSPAKKSAAKTMRSGSPEQRSAASKKLGSQKKTTQKAAKR